MRCLPTRNKPGEAYYAPVVNNNPCAGPCQTATSILRVASVRRSTIVARSCTRRRALNVIVWLGIYCRLWSWLENGVKIATPVALFPRGDVVEEQQFFSSTRAARSDGNGKKMRGKRKGLKWEEKWRRRVPRSTSRPSSFFLTFASDSACKRWRYPLIRSRRSLSEWR